MEHKDYNWPEGWTVKWVKETGSTNDDLCDQARSGASHLTALFADHQTSGHGRLDRTWVSEPGSSLLLSILFRGEPNFLGTCQRMVAVSTVRACRHFDRRVALKWPNDLLFAERKLGGILSVADLERNFVVVGIGINLDWSPPGAAKLNGAEYKTRITSAALLDQILREISRIAERGVAEVHSKYVASLATLGREVRIELANNRFVTGRAIEVDIDGRLAVIESRSGRKHVFDSGDVVHLRTATSD